VRKKCFLLFQCLDTVGLAL